MANLNIEQKIESLVKEPINQLGYEIYDVQYVKEGKDYYLRILIEKPNGLIDLNDCEKVNDAITDVIDNANYIKEQYFLEISSTGVERIIRKEEHLKKHIGQLINIKLFKPVQEQKEYIGELKEFNEDKIIIIKDNKEIVIDRKDISLIKKYFKW